jgi:hypothetical protein
MQKKVIIVLIIVVLIFGNVFQFAWNSSRFPRNAVPDAETAIKIAQATFSYFLEPIRTQSAGYIYWSFETDFHRLRGVWIVSAYPIIPEGVGLSSRSPIITIRMRDAKIMRARFV